MRISHFVVFLFLSIHSVFAQSLSEEIYRAADSRVFDPILFQKVIDSEKDSVRVNAAIALGRMGGEQVSLPLQQLLSDKNESVRFYAALGLGISGVSDSDELLIKQYNLESSDKVREEILLALGRAGTKTSALFLTQALKKHVENPLPDGLLGNVLQGLGMIAAWNKTSLDIEGLDFKKILLFSQLKKRYAVQAAFVLSRLPEHELKISEEQLISAIKNAKLAHAQSKLMIAWRKRSDKKLGKQLVPYLTHHQSAVAIEAIRSLSIMANDKVVAQKLFQWIVAKKGGFSEAALDSLSQGGESQLLNRAIETALNSDIPELQVRAMSILMKNSGNSEKNDEKASKFIKTLNDQSSRYLLVQIIQLINPSKMTNKSALLEHFKTLKDTFVLKATDDEIKKLANIDSSKESEKTSPPANKTPLFTDAFLSSQKRVEIKTNRGDIVIKMSPLALFTAHNFVTLVKRGYYDGTIFSRVIPNFVAQGGEAHGDGTGSVGYSIREEINEMSHTPRSVGMATSGKDTGGAQFYINLGMNLHLDRHYTVFGHVESGWNIAAALEKGDWIIRASVLD